MGMPAPKGRCCVNSYFINTVNCDKRAIKTLVPLKLFLHLEQLYHQNTLHIALYTELAALTDNITALLNNRYRNHRSLENYKVISLPSFNRTISKQTCHAIVIRTFPI